MTLGLLVERARATVAPAWPVSGTDVTIWAKAALPTVLALGGVALVVAAPRTADTTAVSTAAAWIDSPRPDLAVADGKVLVQAHASASASLTSLDLVVDGTTVATDDSLEVDHSLVYATFSWDATPGTHGLVVKAPGVESTVDTVVVGGPGTKSATADDPTADSSTTSSTPSADATVASDDPSSTTTVAVGTPDPRITAAPVPAAPTTPGQPPPTNPSPTDGPSPTGPPVTTGPAAPRITAAELTTPAGPPLLISTSGYSCASDHHSIGVQGVVTASVSGATSVSVTFTSPSGTHTATKSIRMPTAAGGTVTVSSAALQAVTPAANTGSLSISDDYGSTWTVTVTAQGPGGTSSQHVGQLMVAYYCVKP